MVVSRLRHVLLLGGLAAAGATACTSSSDVFTCASDSDCTGAGNGECQSNGFCAFPDVMCESGLRYGEFAGGGYAQMCVPQEAPGSTGLDSASETSGSPTSTDPTLGETTTTSPSTSGDGSSTSGEDAGTTGAASSSGSSGGEVPTCQVLLEEDFADDGLPAGWVALGQGTVDVAGGVLELHPSAPAGDLPVFAVYDAQVGFEGAWLMAHIDSVSPQDGMAGALTLVRSDESATFELIYSSESTVLARARDDTKQTSMQSKAILVDGDNPPWLRIRESEGRVLFEHGPDPENLVVFHEFDTDVRDWSGGFLIAADNLVDLDGDAHFGVDLVSACVVSF